jgi:cysteine synthase A
MSLRMGAELITVPTCAISNPQHYVNVARSLAKKNNGFFTNQFENTANYKAHFECTGPEIWRQTNGKIDMFVMSSGTGGTISGVSK